MDLSKSHINEQSFALFRAAVFADKWISIDDISNMMGISKRTIYRLQKRGEFPQPTTFTRRIKRWKRQEIELWIKSKMEIEQ